MAQGPRSGTDKVMVTVAGLVAAAVAQRVVMLAWRAVRGTDPNDDDDSPLGEILVFAAVSAATVSAARAWATHRTRDKLGAISKQVADDRAAL